MKGHDTGANAFGGLTMKLNSLYAAIVGIVSTILLAVYNDDLS